MKRNLTILLSLLSFSFLYPQTNFRTEINFPDIFGFKTLKCDFHMHTVFSDGYVWPTFRVEEAWHEGLDAIAFTDHIEYQPKKDYIPTNHNAPFDIAKSKADELGIVLIKGVEITRKMPPGHLNAIFVQDASKLVNDDWKAVVNEAKRQGAIINWNHPGWTGQQPDGIPKWYDEHTYLLDNNLLDGIEVVNSVEYYPKVHQWCIEKNLTIIGNSDTHYPTGFDSELNHGIHRAMTLVFAESKSSDAIKDALLKRRTAVFFENKLIGDEKYLNEIFKNSIKFNKTSFSAIGRETIQLQITNQSDITYELELVEENENITLPKQIELKAGKTVLFPIRAKRDNLNLSQSIDIKYKVKNLLIAPETGLPVSFNFTVDIKPKK